MRPVELPELPELLGGWEAMMIACSAVTFRPPTSSEIVAKIPTSRRLVDHHAYWTGDLD
jgi:hypothetical protein